MRNLTSLHGPRPVATAPSSAAYRVQADRLVTFSGFVPPAAVTRVAPEARPAAARKAA